MLDAQKIMEGSRALWGLGAMLLCFCFTVLSWGASALDTHPTPSPPSAPDSLAANDDLPQGDIVILRSGAILRGLQVITDTPGYMELEVFAGEQPLRISRRLIAKVVFDDKGPVGVEDNGDNGDDGKRVIPLPSTALPPELVKPLLPSHAGKPLVFTQMDLVEILTELAKMAAIRISISEAVRDLPSVEKQWSLDVGVGDSFLSVLDALMREKPSLTVTFQGGLVVVVKRDNMDDTNHSTQTPAPDEADLPPPPATTPIPSSPEK